jgi:hypothetical protein
VRWIRRSIGISLPSSRTAFGNIALPLEIAGHGRGPIKARVESLLFLNFAPVTVGDASPAGRGQPRIAGRLQQLLRFQEGPPLPAHDRRVGRWYGPD